MTANRSTIAHVPSQQRSAVTNGRRLFVSGDGTSAWARRQRDLETLYADDLGGESQMTAIQAGIIRTAATLRVELERLEGKLSEGEEVDIEKFARVGSHYRRLCEALGIERRARDVTLDLHTYLKKSAGDERDENRRGLDTESTPLVAGLHPDSAGTSFPTATPSSALTAAIECLPVGSAPGCVPGLSSAGSADTANSTSESRS